MVLKKWLKRARTVYELVKDVMPPGYDRLYDQILGSVE